LASLLDLISPSATPFFGNCIARFGNHRRRLRNEVFDCSWRYSRRGGTGEWARLFFAASGKRWAGLDEISDSSFDARFNAFSSSCLGINYCRKEEWLEKEVHERMKSNNFCNPLRFPALLLLPRRCKISLNQHSSPTSSSSSRELRTFLPAHYPGEGRGTKGIMNETEIWGSLSLSGRAWRGISGRADTPLPGNRLPRTGRRRHKEEKQLVHG